MVREEVADAADDWSGDDQGHAVEISPVSGKSLVPCARRQTTAFTTDHLLPAAERVCINYIHPNARGDSTPTLSCSQVE